MGERARKLLDELLTLPVEEQVSIVETVAQRLDERDDDPEWTPELQARLDRALDPATPTHSLDDVIAHAEASRAK